MGDSLLETIGSFNMVKGVDPSQASIEPNLSILTGGGYDVAKLAQVVVLITGWYRRHWSGHDNLNRDSNNQLASE